MYRKWCICIYTTYIYNLRQHRVMAATSVYVLHAYQAVSRDVHHTFISLIVVG